MGYLMKLRVPTARVLLILSSLLVSTHYPVSNRLAPSLISTRLYIKPITQEFSIRAIVPETPEITETKGKEVSRGDFNLEKPLIMRASAYIDYGITSSGRITKVGRTVAVDPRVVPFGSRLHIEFPKPYDFKNGEYVAEDTGGAIKGNTVDIYWGSDENSAMEFGHRMIKVYIERR